MRYELQRPGILRSTPRRRGDQIHSESNISYIPSASYSETESVPENSMSDRFLPVDNADDSAPPTQCKCPLGSQEGRRQDRDEEMPFYDFVRYTSKASKKPLLMTRKDRPKILTTQQRPKRKRMTRENRKRRPLRRR